MSSLKPKILIAGVGRFGMEHLREWKRLAAEGKVEIAGAVVASEESRRRIQQMFGIPAWTALEPSLLNAVDAVDIVTPSATHFALTKRCLEFTNVLTEKPLAMTADEARELALLAGRQGRVLSVNHLFRFNPALHRLKEVIDAEPATPQFVKGVFLQPADNGLPGNLSPNHELIHYFDALDYLFGKTPHTFITEKTGSVNQVSLRYPDALNAVLTLGWHAGPKIRTLDFEYPDHKLSVNFLNNVIILLRRDAMEKIVVNGAEGALRRSLEAFLASLRDGATVAGTDAKTGARIVEVAERALPGPRRTRDRVGIIGGGVFGVSCALEFSRHAEVKLFERHTGLMEEASFQNQWRFHSGFHYPRSVQTVLEIQSTRADFCSVFGDAVNQLTSYYCTSNTGVEITRERYLAACVQNKLSFEIEETPPRYVNSNLIDLCLKTDESVFDFYKLRGMAESMLAADPNIEVALGSEVVNGQIEHNGSKVLTVRTPGGTRAEAFDYLINTTYANNNLTSQWFNFPVRRLRFDYCEMAVMKVPMPDVCLTVLDGPFCSLVSTGYDGIFLLSHVDESVLKSRITADGLPPAWGRVQSNSANLIKSCVPYFPLLKDAELIESRFGVRVVEANSEDYDGRPTVVTGHGFGCWSVLGGKIGTCVANARDIVRQVFPETVKESLRPKLQLTSRQRRIS